MSSIFFWFLFSMSSALVWFRRDLRVEDHAALFHALKTHGAVYCVFVFDSCILHDLPRADRRVEFILRAVEELAAALRAAGGELIILHGDPVAAIPALAAVLGVGAVYANRDYEPAARARDAAVEKSLSMAKSTQPVAFLRFKDQVIFDCDEILTQQGTPFSVFTPYKKAWLQRVTEPDLQAYPVAHWLNHLANVPVDLSTVFGVDDAVQSAGQNPGQNPGQRVTYYPVPPTLEQLGFAATNLSSLGIPVGMQGARSLFLAFAERIDHYASDRDFPAVDATSGLSPHLRFGTVSIRRLARYAHAEPGRGAATWLSELIWREFYQMILWHAPHVVGAAYKPALNTLVWDDAPELLAAWQQGRTGYPLVDAAMRQLVHTGLMHNRLRMVAASFLTKDLGVDWRLGAAWFAEHLLDYDLAANNGGWQWAASTGCDAQPWFRIFNPVTQSEKFDPHGVFIRRFVPELADVPTKYIHAPWKMPGSSRGLVADAEAGPSATGRAESYPPPMVEHAAARERALQRFSRVKNAAE
jgi:deoxyribodipyrimidine photo-lyase